MWLFITILTLVALFLILFYRRKLSRTKAAKGVFSILPQSKRDEQARILSEDIIKVLYKAEEKGLDTTSIVLSKEINGTSNSIEKALLKLLSNGLINLPARTLTEKGKQEALRIIRQHRLYELYLSEKTGIRPEEWHDAAEKMEHKLAPKETKEIEAQLGYPRYDPHGDPIPREDGTIPEYENVLLSDWEGKDQWLQVVHLEDEPQADHEHLLKLGLAYGTIFKLIETAPDGPVIEINRNRSKLTPDQAAMLNVCESRITPPKDLHRLSELPTHTEAEVWGIDPACRGMARRRLLDLGFVKGSKVRIDMVSPMGNPIAYLLRGTTIALRHDQADKIEVVFKKEKSTR